MVRPLTWFLFLGIWGSLSAYATAWDVLAFRQPLGPALQLNLGRDAIWSALSLLLVQFGRRVPVATLSPPNWRALSLNLGAVFAAAALGLALAGAVTLGLSLGTRWNADPGLPWAALQMEFRNGLRPVLLAFGCLAGANQFYLVNARIRRQDVERAQLQAALAEARYQALLSRLQPHFLFNALNSIAALVRLDPEGAERMVELLGELMRLTLTASASPMVALRLELAMARTYLAIEQVRFPTRLDVEVAVPEALRDVKVPVFILQPLVENSLKHGLAPKARGGRIQIRAEREGDRLILVVQDDGTGFESAQEGTGLANTRARLALLYPGRQGLEIFTVYGRGTRVVVTIPILREGLEVALR